MKYRKKPVVVDAVRYDGTNKGEIEEFTGERLAECVDAYKALTETDPLPCLIIHTLEGNMKAEPGDYIIRGVKGEFYPCKPDIFEQTYEPADC